MSDGGEDSSQVRKHQKIISSSCYKIPSLSRPPPRWMVKISEGSNNCGAMPSTANCETYRQAYSSKFSMKCFTLILCARAFTCMLHVHHVHSCYSQRSKEGAPGPPGTGDTEIYLYHVRAGTQIYVSCNSQQRALKLGAADQFISPGSKCTTFNVRFLSIYLCVCTCGSQSSCLPLRRFLASGDKT